MFSSIAALEGYVQYQVKEFSLLSEVEIITKGGLVKEPVWHTSEVIL